MCLAQGHKAVRPVRLEPPATQSRVKHSTTEPLHLPNPSVSSQALLPISHCNLEICKLIMGRNNNSRFIYCLLLTSTTALCRVSHPLLLMSIECNLCIGETPKWVLLQTMKTQMTR